MPYRPPSNASKTILVSILALAAFTLFLPHSHAQPANSNAEFEFPEGIFTEISGKYASEESGIEIEFPNGWSGLDFAGMAFVVPGGLDASSETSSAHAAMMVMVLPRGEFSNAFSSLEAVSEQMEQNAADPHCQIETYSYTKINSMDGIHIAVECDANEGYSNAEMYGIMSRDSFILVAFAAGSKDDYNDHVGSFQQSVRTLKVDNAVSFRTAIMQALDLKTLNHSVIARGDQVDLRIHSNSDVSNLSFSESHKRISVRVEGPDGTDGMIIISVDKVLEGPYTVTIDGQTTSNFVVAEDLTTGEKSIEISYNHSVHDISITGTNVVPEFPPAALASILGIVGVLAVLGRIRLVAKV